MHVSEPNSHPLPSDIPGGKRGETDFGRANMQNSCISGAPVKSMDSELPDVHLAGEFPMLLGILCRGRSDGLSMCKKHLKLACFCADIGSVAVGIRIYSRACERVESA